MNFRTRMRVVPSKFEGVRVEMAYRSGTARSMKHGGQAAAAESTDSQVVVGWLVENEGI